MYLLVCPLFPLWRFIVMSQMCEARWVLGTDQMLLVESRVQLSLLQVHEGAAAPMSRRTTEKLHHC